MTTKAVSFRAQLKGTLLDFLTKEDMRCPHTEEGLLDLVVALSRGVPGERLPQTRAGERRASTG